MISRNRFQGFLRFVVIAQLESYRSSRTFDIELTGGRPFHLVGLVMSWSTNIALRAVFGLRFVIVLRSVSGDTIAFRTL